MDCVPKQSSILGERQIPKSRQFTLLNGCSVLQFHKTSDSYMLELYLHDNIINTFDSDLHMNVTRFIVRFPKDKQ